MGKLLNLKNPLPWLSFNPKRCMIRNNNLKSLPAESATTSYESLISTITSSNTLDSVPLEVLS